MPTWARVLFAVELALAAAFFAFLPSDGAEAAGFSAIVLLLATVAISTCVGWVAARRDLAVRLLLANSA
jgi:hypothetical protein